MRTGRNLTRLVAALAAATTLAACEDSPTGPEGEQTGEPYRWAATYAAAEKFGGAAGTWRATTDVMVTADRRVMVGNTEIVNPQIGESTISWSMQDGNRTNASLQLLTESTSDYFWGNVGVAGKLFQGWIQYPGQGKLDYRGLAR
jgi:hypothetical protein